MELTIFVHGFNNGHDRAEDVWQKTHQLLRDIPLPQRKLDTLMLFYWPGDESQRMRSVMKYFDKVAVAVLAGAWLADYLTAIGAPNRPVRVNFVGHSLGCRVVLSALRALDGSAAVSPERVVLMAPAVPEGLCENGRSYGVKRARSELVMFSTRDEALGPRWLGLNPFRLGQWGARHAPFLAAEEDPGERRAAVGLHGGPPGIPRRWDGEDISTGLAHGDYWVDSDTVRRMAAVFGAVTERAQRSRRPKIRRTEERPVKSRRTGDNPRLRCP